MRRCTLFITALALAATGKAQTVATFESQPLTGSDTFYVNYSASGTDVGFNDGLAHFPCVYDTSFGGVWSGGFAYSNMTDSVTSGYMNSYSAKTAIGYGGSAKYAAVWCSDPLTYAPQIRVILTGAAVGKTVSGFYVTNGTYPYNSMRDGDGVAKKFGGTTGNDPDWFLLTVKGYRSGALTADSVNFYLADYRFVHNDSDYIVKDWQWVNLLPLGHVDSLQFHLSSSDNGSFGMNTPGYFCMDNFTTNETGVSVDVAPSVAAARVYPNPADDVLYVDVTDNGIQTIVVADMSGRTVGTYAYTGQQIAINTSSLPAGMYLLQLTGSGRTATAKFAKR